MTIRAAIAALAIVLAGALSIIGDQGAASSQPAAAVTTAAHHKCHHRHHKCTRRHPCVNPGGINIPA